MITLPTVDLDARVWPRVERGDGCWTILGRRTTSRPTIQVDGQTYLLYRVVFNQCVEPIGDRVACHRCDNPVCIRPDHIFAGSQADNVADMIAKGRRRVGEKRRGESHPNAAVPDAEVARAREMYATRSRSQASIAAELGVSQHVVGQWLRGEGRAEGRPSLTAGKGPAYGRQVKPCGTRAAYERHRRRGEPSCEPCRLAENAQHRTRSPRAGAAA